MSLEMIEKYKFIAILRHIKPEYIHKSAEALCNGGIRIFEVTFNPSSSTTIKDTKYIISEIYNMYGEEVCVGAGTVINTEFAAAAKDAGAKFIVSPCTDKDVISYTKQNGMLSIPGAYTPTEIMNACKLGADIVKIFPILPTDINYLKNIISPLSHIPFMTTGGVNPDTVSMFLDCGAAAVAAGATIITPQLAESGQFDVIEKNARAHVEKIVK